MIFSPIQKQLLKDIIIGIFCLQKLNITPPKNLKFRPDFKHISYL